MSSKKVAVVIGATGNLGTAVCSALESSNFEIDDTWRSADHPDACLEDSYNNLPKKIDAAIYLAGTNHICQAESISIDDWDRLFNINIRGAYIFFKSAFPSLCAAKRSTILGISSIMATHPYPGRLAYAASKAGLEGLIRGLAVEWGRHGIASHGIRLGHLSGLMKSTVANPGLLDAVKKFSPLNNLIDPADVANYISWVVSGGAHSMTGSIVDFDPGYTINRWPME